MSIKGGKLDIFFKGELSVKKHIALLVVILAGCESPLVGSMSETNICQTAGYIIRQKLGDNFKTAEMPCKAQNPYGNVVEIEAGYISPIGGGTKRHYSAIGSVTGDRLRIEKIRVHEADDDYVDFKDFPS